MSRENLEVAGRAYDAWNRADLDALVAIYHPEVEWDFSNFEGWPEESVIRGPDAVRSFLEEWRAIFGDYEFGVERVIDVDERVVSLCRQGGSGRESSRPAIMEFAQILTIRGGRIVRVENYSDRREALERVGLEE
jgi:ketosteroid isomerase-like protein